MPIPHLDFRRTWLWRHVFVNRRSDATVEEQDFFRTQLLQMRDNVSPLVERISRDIPGLTVHDISHLDALWDTASLVSKGSITLSPPEGFVFGASVLLHDSALTVAAYPGGIDEIKRTVVWRDAFAGWLQNQRENGRNDRSATCSMDAEFLILPHVLRRLHAQQAAALAELAWISHTGQQQYLISDTELRSFFGKTIGDIAHSHWWSVQRLEQEFAHELGAYPRATRNLVDRLKIACLLRIADALHLDLLRAPRFLRTLTRPEGVSRLHWTFQEKLARPHIESDAVVFTTGQAFRREEAEAWWLAYDTLLSVDRELADVDVLLQARGRKILKARRVKGIESPETLAQTVQTIGWRPVNAQIKVSDVPRIVQSLGGSNLYGNDPLVPLRELIQNSADAVQARRRFQGRDSDWGEIKVWLEYRDDSHWLVVEDNGIGMSEPVMTGPLLDFGVSFWRSSLVMEEFPGLVASGMQPIGRFGIGFFSVFMLGDIVRVISRRCDQGDDSARVLEIRGGPGGRPILWPARKGESPLDGGTRVELCLRKDPHGENGLLWDKYDAEKHLLLSKVVAGLAPSLDVNIVSGADQDARRVVTAGDWLQISDIKLLRRLDFVHLEKKVPTSAARLMRPLTGSDGREIYGRATILPQSNSSLGSGWVTVSGLRANSITNVEGVLAGKAITAARDTAVPIVPKEVLSAWATEQARLLHSARLDDELKAFAAEVVLECGGDIGNLPVARWGKEWMNASEFKAKIAALNELVLKFGGELYYDEDEDEMHPRDFRDDFEVSKNVISVLVHDGTIVSGRTVSWPASMFGDREGVHRLHTLIRRIVEDTWPTGFDESDERRVVGKAAGYEVKREVTVFTKLRSGGRM